MTAPVYDNLALYQIHDKYMEAFNLLTDPDEDFSAEVAQDTLASIEGEFEEKSINVVKYSRNLEATIKAIKQAEESMAKRRKALESKVKFFESYLKENMESTGITHIDCPLFEIAIAKNPPSVSIINEEEIPKKFKHTITETRINKTDIKKAIKTGESVPGAALMEGTRLTIK